MRQAVRLAGVGLMTLVLAGCGGGSGPGETRQNTVPVEVAPVETGRITLVRNLAGTLRASNDFTVAPKVSGQVRNLRKRVADTVTQKDVLATLDDEPFVQEMKRAEADLLVAEANHQQATAEAAIAKRGMERVRQLNESGFVSETQYDEALTNELAATAALKVAEAQVVRAEADLESARIRLGYTQIRAEWTGGHDERVVAERFIDEGDSVSVNQPMFRVVDLDPLLALVYLTEVDYPRVAVGDPVTVRTDAYPGETFSGEVVRIAPVFSEMSRQAAVEFHVPNQDERLKPGMFVRASMVLEIRENTRIIPLAALVNRAQETGVFLLEAESDVVRWVPVRTGIQEGERIEVLEPEFDGQVVILGQQLLEDGSQVRVTNLFTGGKE